MPWLDKIIRIIREPRWSLHDASRVEVTSESPLLRFNMPFECGLAGLGVSEKEIHAFDYVPRAVKTDDRVAKA